MKNLNEVKKYLFNVGHKQDSIYKIEGFLIEKGLLGKDFEMEYMVGDNSFNDFKNWFDSVKSQPEDDEFGYGDFIHIDDNIGNVLCLSSVCRGNFIGTDGASILSYSMNNNSRPCVEDEIDKVVEAMHENGVDFILDVNEFVPYCESQEDSNDIDALEIQSKEAIENITAALLSNEIDDDERAMVIQAMHTLVELGKMYE